jgi:hypothetical protein
MGGPPLPNQTMAQSSILSMIAQQANLTPEQTQQLDYLLTLTPEQVRETLEYTLLAFEHVAKTLEHRDRTAEHRDRACEQVTKHVSTVVEHLTRVTTSVEESSWGESRRGVYGVDLDWQMLSHLASSQLS